MGEKKTTDILLERIKYFINAVDNGEYEPSWYEFTVKLHKGSKLIEIKDCCSTQN